ncbi:hypothetical protein AMJ40_06000 [candidate division TA06 bacterium DG_26]|uniref:Uncharacterized protein n=1 Tax=candidate division TA06 bacterium DG_26 TaxID=1703771 RepID=A0A0S7WGF7_UNCT6|nr:MAG: hypothetical protein AMJ40_06000 [candidate division TA06 bacterium DG_26]
MAGLLPAKVTLSLSKQPKLGEEVDLLGTVTPEIDVPRLKIRFGFRGDVHLVSGHPTIYTSARGGETKTHAVRVVFKSSDVRVSLHAGSCHKNQKGEEVVCPAHGSRIWLSVVDEQTGQFSSYHTYQDWLNRRSRHVFMLYNGIDSEWLPQPTMEFYELNRHIAQEMRKYEPALSDSEALCLHEDNYKLIINGIGSAGASDSVRIEYMLEAGWLKAQRAGSATKRKWLKEFMEKNKGEWKNQSDLN